jgi:DNA end-binding protein Ku
MALNLVDSFAGDFQPQDYGDDYRDQLQQLIDAKLDGGEAFDTPAPEDDDDADVVDLLAALKRSVERHKGSAEKPAAAAEDGPAKKAPAARKQTAKPKADRDTATPAAKRSRAKTA